VQHEDVIRRINHLEATNIQLREEAEKYQAERTAYRTQVENDSDALTSELQEQIQRLDADLTRVRHNRDELTAELSMSKVGQDQDRASTDLLQELTAAKEDRIKALESELERIRLARDGASEPTPSSEVLSLSLDELRTRYQNLEQQFQSINQEMPSMQAAYKRAQAAASKKIADFSALEDKIQVLQLEKNKADHKYFAARKDMDMRIQEVRYLRAETAKSSEVISQLKDVEGANRALLSNLEKQLSDVRHANIATAGAHKKLESQAKDAANKVDSLTKQVAELQNLLKNKDTDHASTKERIQAAETDLERLRVKYEQAQKDRDAWKVKSLSNQSGEEEMLRTFALCTICRKDFKNTAIKTCGHTFCNNCVEDRIANRMRKCPNCSRAFDKSDVMTIHM
jgi:E3 ubiquitin-protein ligase BRE1